MEDSKKTTIVAAAAPTPAPASLSGIVDAERASAEAAGKAAAIAGALAHGGAAVVATTIKPGVKTSEFWLTTLFATVSQVLTLVGAIPGPWGIVTSALAVVAYNISRGMAKQ